MRSGAPEKNRTVVSISHRLYEKNGRQGACNRVTSRLCMAETFLSFATEMIYWD